MRAKDLKNILVPLILGGKTYKMAFDFNFMCELDEVYGDFEKAMKSIESGKGRLKAIRAVVYSAIKSRHEEVTLLKIGEALTEVMQDPEKAEYLMEQINKAITLAMPTQEELGE